jgi:hypothetical protein
VLVSAPGAQFAKVFWLLFFKKVTAFFPYLKIFYLFPPHDAIQTIFLPSFAAAIYLQYRDFSDFGLEHSGAGGSLLHVGP